MCSSPRLIAAYRVLLRLMAPRHPPYALRSLISLLGRTGFASRTPRGLRSTLPVLVIIAFAMTR